MRMQQVQAIAYRIELEKCEKENERLRRELGIWYDIMNEQPNAEDLYDEFTRLKLVEGTG